MKTSQDFNNNFEQYNAYIEKEIANLNRMREEIQANGAVAQQIINDLEPVLEKLHLKIEEFTMNQPNKEVASHKGLIMLRLVSDGKFKFIKFAGYTSRGAGKNEGRLDSKAEKMADTVIKALGSSYKNFDCYVNFYSLEVKNESEQGTVLMNLSYTF